MSLVIVTANVNLYSAIVTSL